MNDNTTLLVVGALGLGIFYMMNKDKDNQQAQQQALLQQQILAAQRAAQQQQQQSGSTSSGSTSAGTKIVNTVNTGLQLLPGLLDAWGNLKTTFAGVPQSSPANSLMFS